MPRMWNAFYFLACTTGTAISPLLPGESAPDTTDTASPADPWQIDRQAGCNPLATSDDCFLPYPSYHYTIADDTAPSGRRLAYFSEMFTGPDGGLPIDPEVLNFADGVSPVSMILVNFAADVDPSQLWGWGEQEDSLAAGAPIALMNATTGERVPLLTEMDETNRELTDYADRHALIIRPMAPMEPGARYLVVLTQALRSADGDALTSPDAFIALRDGILTSDADVEDMRARFEGLFETAAAAGYPRQELLLAWDLQVASEEGVTGPIRSMRQQLFADIDEQGVPYTIEDVEVDPNGDVAFIVRGSFQPTSFLTADNDLVLSADFSVAQQADIERPSYPFTMLIPPAARERGGLPLVVFGHGIFGTGESYLTSESIGSIVQAMSNQNDAVVIATDWIGLSSSDLELITSEVVTDLSRITLVSDRLAQSLINNLALTELALGELSADPAIDLGHSEPLLDAEQVYYYGISLGGIQGSSLAAISPRISRAVAAVPGGAWSSMIQRSVNFEEIEVLIDLLYPDPLSQTLFIAALQSFFDRSDPAGLISMLNNDPDYPELDEKLYLIQEAIGDCQVPNISTDILARAAGAAHLTIATDPIYGLDTIAGPTTHPAITQIRIPDRLAEFFPPDENTIPETNNGVHSAIIDEAPTMEQVSEVLTTGLLVHPCDGECDPY